MKHEPFLVRVTRKPLIYHQDIATEIRQDFQDLGPQTADILAACASCAPYLRDMMKRESTWLHHALNAPPEAVLADIFAQTQEAGLDSLPNALREAKRRVALLAAVCDLTGVWSLENVTEALTNLADLAVSLCVSRLVGDEIRRGKLPNATPQDASTGAGMVVLAMGKMGAYELNYSSDIDLICLFDQDRYGQDWQEARAAFIRVTRKMSAILSDITDQGYVFRTDLRLRPDASVTPVCMSMAAAYNYYEAEGRTWERAAYIKARPCAGDLAAGARFLASLKPFVWRKHLDYAAIQDAYDMRLRIRDHRGLHGIAVEGHNVKLGAGGIREIEFFTQTRQLIAGGRDESLRDQTTCGGLAALAAKNWIPPEIALELQEQYRWLRELEHRLQMVNDAQTQTMPNTAEGVARIAAFMGQTEADFRATLLARLRRTDQLTEGFFAPSDTETGPELSEHDRHIVENWHSYPCMRSERAQKIFDRLKPQFLKRLSQAANQSEGLIALDGFLKGLPAGVQLFSLFEANPSLIDLIIDIAGTSPGLAQYLSRHAAVLDAVIGGSFFTPWPGPHALRQELSDKLAEVGDYERQLDAARRWMKEWRFRIGVHHLRGLIDGFEAGKSYADLAEAVIQALWPVVVADFSAKHGAPPGRGAVLLGMGSLGAGRLNAASDLDLILIYDAQNIEQSDGPRPLATRPYYARLTQAMVTALSAQTAEGRLYEVDVRLRPSGRQGPVATALESFKTYQKSEAWSWEHLALTRARVMAGDHTLAQDVEVFRREMITQKGQNPALRADIEQMRHRLREAKPATSVWDPKNGPGRIMDIELLAETLALMTANPARQIDRQISGAKLLFEPAKQIEILAHYRLLWQLYVAGKLLTPNPLKLEALGEGGRDFILRQTGFTSVSELEAALTQGYGHTQALIDAFFTV